MGFKLNHQDDYDSIEVKLSKFPYVFKTKCEEYVEQGLATDMDDAAKQLKDCTIELELFYDKHYGLFGVESEAVESISDEMVSPYTKEIAENANEEWE